MVGRVRGSLGFGEEVFILSLSLGAGRSAGLNSDIVSLETAQIPQVKDSALQDHPSPLNL